MKLTWLNGRQDDPQDWCAHSRVLFSIGDEVLLRPEDGDWTVSTAGLYLLRTLERSHTRSDFVGEFLFPCCGNMMIAYEGQDDVFILECGFGRDFEVVHAGDEVVVTAPDGRRFEVPFAKWQGGVHRFCDSVEAFYDGSSAKVFDFGEEDDLAKGYRKFWEEWERRRCTPGLFGPSPTRGTNNVES